MNRVQHDILNLYCCSQTVCIVMYWLHVCICFSN